MDGEVNGISSDQLHDTSLLSWPLRYPRLSCSQLVLYRAKFDSASG